MNVHVSARKILLTLEKTGTGSSESISRSQTSDQPSAITTSRERRGARPQGNGDAIVKASRHHTESRTKAKPTNNE